MAKDDLGSFIGIVLGAIGLLALAKALSEKKCLRCGGINHRDNNTCQYCGSYLK